MSIRRMLPFIFLNILVSAAVVLTILWWWDSRQPVEPAAGAMVRDNEQAEALPREVAASEALPAPTETPMPLASQPDSHVVQAGETLGQISARYSVPLQEIMDANGMDDPNFLAVGQELIIPQAGEPLPAAEPAEEESNAAEATLPAPIPTEPAPEGEARIEIAEVIGVGELSLEAVQIVNNGSSQTLLQGWELRDGAGTTYTFGQVTLFGDGAGILVHTATGRDSATDLYWGQERALWQSGDMVILADDSGSVQAEFEIP